MRWTDEPPDKDLVASSDWTSKPPDEDLKESSFGSKVGGIAMGALETMNAPLQIAGESIRGASESEPLQIATAEDPRGFRAPSIAQRIMPSLKTEKPPADPFVKAYQGLEGITTLPYGLKTASDMVTREPGLVEQIGGMGIGAVLGAGAAKRSPKPPAIPPRVPGGATAAEDLLTIPKGTAGKSATMEAAEDFASRPPKPPPAAGAGPEMPPPGTPSPGKGPLDEVFETVQEKFKPLEETKGIPRNLGRLMHQKGRGMRIKEIGGTPGQVRQLKDRFGEEAVNELADLADRKGVTKGFFNFQTGDAITKLDQTAGRQLGAMRQIVSQRGGVHDKAKLIQQIRQELDPIYMSGTGSTQKGTYLKALKDIEKAGPDVASMADAITETNKFIAKNKLVLPLNATKKVMQVANRLNNERAAQFLNPQELKLYNESLKDVQAAKIFNKMYGFTYGRDMAGRTGPGSIWNTVKDLGGRKIMEKIYSNVGRWMEGREEIGSIKELGSEVLDAIDDALDEVIEQMGSSGPQSKAFGGIVAGGMANEMDEYLSPRYGEKPNV